MTPERQAEIIVGNCCMCRNPDITTPNPDMCRECKLRKSIEEALSALTRERDELKARCEKLCGLIQTASRERYCGFDMLASATWDHIVETAKEVKHDNAK